MTIGREFQSPCSVFRDLRARVEDHRMITIQIAPETAGMPPGPLLRSEGESDERYAQRRALFNDLLALPDE